MNKKILSIIIFIFAVSLVGLGLIIFKFRTTSVPGEIKENISIENKEEVNALSIYHWWTSPGETAAINKLISVFTQKYPDVAVISAPVVGGAGFGMFSLIKPLVVAGEAPDAFQMHAGYEAMPYFNAGLLDPIDVIWETEGLEKVIPKVIQDMCKFGGHYYAVPVDVHRVNLVWYNKKLLNKNNIDPGTLISWDVFFAACDKLRKSGVQYPIQMGAAWISAHVFEQILVSCGIDFYADIINGKVTQADDLRLLQALEIFKKYLSYTNLDSDNLKDWVIPIKRVISGEGAFNIMGDWANGEFKVIGMKYGQDYGAFPAPSTNNVYGLCIDTFQHPGGVAHPVNSYRWLRVIVSKEGQDAFNPLKGSIPVRLDADTASYDDYQKSAIDDFSKAKYMYPSIVHGSGAPDSFKLKFNEIVRGFIVDLDVTKAASSITTQIKQSISEYTKAWNLR